MFLILQECGNHLLFKLLSFLTTYITEKNYFGTVPKNFTNIFKKHNIRSQFTPSQYIIQRARNALNAPKCCNSATDVPTCNTIISYFHTYCVPSQRYENIIMLATKYVQCTLRFMKLLVCIFKLYIAFYTVKECIKF